MRINLRFTRRLATLTFLLEGGNRGFSFRFGVSVDLTGVDVLGEDVVVDDDDAAAVVDRLGVLNVFGNGGLSFFCLLTSPSKKSSF